ncbi:hypothetical protein AJ78_04299 [Emergomyces pasteurianus Ep9510]|uniref:F-box domain-containing protein n=1 Tax=Emergomyces pasteurianus Ep9510 TaxID=1447872 RepID=A0A1J9PHR6_9EURO|nr:hypothetical protein AJ78_04299 [Emergomyces pasteurianus Ep9510]
MEILPAEVTGEIFRNLSKESLKIVRLTSKKLSALSSPLLFDRIYASSHLHDLEVLSAISRHPVLSLYIQKMVFSGVFFHSPSKKSDNKSISELDFEKGLQYYKRRVEEQNVTLQCREDFAIISTALARMPNIQMIVLTNHWFPTRDLLNDCTYHTRVYGSEDHYKEARFGGPFSRCYPPFAEQPSGKQLKLPGGIRKYVKIDHGFKVMCRALSIARVPVQMLSIDYFTPIRNAKAAAPGISVGSFCLSPRDLNHFVNAFRHLRKISFSFYMDRSDNNWDLRDDSDADNPGDEWLALMEGKVAKVFTAATHLEELTIDFSQSVDRIPLCKFFGAHTWPRLQLLKLFHKEMDQNEMVQLLRRHCKTLKVLHLYFIIIKNGGWPEVAEVMRECVALQSLSFNHLGERVDHGNVKLAILENLKEYVLCGRPGPIYDPDYRPHTPVRSTSASFR